MNRIEIGYIKHNLKKREQNKKKKYLAFLKFMGQSAFSYK
jgi:hypothetical protein